MLRPKKLSSTIVISLLLSQTSLACKQPVTFLPKTSTTECDGYLFTKEAELQNRLKLIDLEYKEKELALSSQLLEAERQKSESLQTSLTAFKDSTNKLADELGKKESRSTWERILYFGLGVLTTIVVIRATN